MLRRTPFFRACNHCFLAALADELTSHVFMPDDAVFYKGDSSTDLYFVLSGACVGHDGQNIAADIF
jgi:CRP-like cAMP-binding protein